jgi:NADPH:quinone reductase-like Zn-dependent oxidoreductase
VRPGEQVLVMGAGSGVTIAALRLARRAGARVITTAGSDAVLERARAELDVDAVIDRRRPDLVEALVDASGGGFDLVLDHVGPAQLQTQIDALALDGRMVLSGTTTGTQGSFSMPSLYHAGKSLLGLGGAGRTTFTDMLDAVDHDALRMVVDDVVPLSEAAHVHQRIESGDFFGKIVLAP